MSPVGSQDFERIILEAAARVALQNVRTRGVLRSIAALKDKSKQDQKINPVRDEDEEEEDRDEEA